MKKEKEQEEKFLIGCFWGLLLSAILWISFFGWLRLMWKAFTN